MKQDDDRNPGDAFEAMIAAGTITFRPATLADLDQWGRQLVSVFLDRAQDEAHTIRWQLGDKRVGTAYCLKLTNKAVNDLGLHYLDVYPDTQQFMWCTEGHHDSIRPDDAGILLLQYKFPNVTIRRTDITSLLYPPERN